MKAVLALMQVLFVSIRMQIRLGRFIDAGDFSPMLCDQWNRKAAGAEWGKGVGR